MARKGIIGLPAYGILKVIYAPWEWVHWHTPFYRPMGMYMSLWVPDTFDRDGRVHGRER
jgi:hypothetical protein